MLQDMVEMEEANLPVAWQVGLSLNKAREQIQQRKRERASREVDPNDPVVKSTRFSRAADEDCLTAAIDAEDSEEDCNDDGKLEGWNEAIAEEALPGGAAGSSTDHGTQKEVEAWTCELCLEDDVAECPCDRCGDRICIYCCEKQTCRHCIAAEAAAAADATPTGDAHANHLSENQRNRIAKNKRDALSRQAAVKRNADLARTQAETVQANREAALKRRIEKDEEHRAQVEMIAAKREAAVQRKAKMLHCRAGFDDGEGDSQNNDEPPDEWKQQSLETRANTEDPPKESEMATNEGEKKEAAPTKKRRLTTKQKYSEAAEDHRRNKEEVEKQWAERSARSHVLATTYQTTVPRANNGTSGHIYEVVNELRGPQIAIEAEAASVPFADGVHTSHRRMLLRNILFCKRCGYWSSKKTQKLSTECRLVPPHSDGRAKLKRMLDGYHPDRTVQAWSDGLSTAIKVKPINLDL